MSNEGESLVVSKNAQQTPTNRRKSIAEQENRVVSEQIPASSDMAVIDDDTILHPRIDDEVLLYITCLNEGHETYTRFFDALLIKRQSHRAFFRDLKAFREQPQPISLLDRAAEDKQLYKEITLVFLSSRFAHPWCRRTPLKKGFWRSEWGTIEGKKKDADIMKEEQRLHKLLVPLWILMRGRMFPSKVVVEKFCAKERERRQLQLHTQLTVSALQHHNAGFDSSHESVLDSLGHSDSENDANDQQEQEHAAAAHAATSVFRLAAAGLLISQTPKRKLRWLVKKPK